MADLKNTQFIDINQTKRISVSEVILRVYQALVERGYNPVNQIVGYIMSGDPTYITSHNNARSLIMGYTAQPLETITRKEENKLRRTLARIEQLVGEYQIEKIVLGYPVNMDGSAGERAELALAFKAMLERRTKLEVIMQDERLTTVAADEILQECGMPREKRKTVIDQVAAGLILQDFMENTNKGSKLADSESDTEEKNNNKNLEVMNSTAD